MKNKIHSIKHIFIKKMAYSAVIQFLVFGLLLITANSYFHHTQLNTISTNLIIDDSFTAEEIARYNLLKDAYALDLELFNLENERKLDSIKFIPSLKQTANLGSCQFLYKGNYRICKESGGIFSGITPIAFDGKILGYIVARKKFNLFYSIPISYGLVLILFVVLGIFLFNFLFLFLSMRKKIEDNTQSLLNFIFHQPDSSSDLAQINIEEYQKIAKKFKDEHNEIEELKKEKTYYEVRKNIAEQVAHDIRSPLAAINTAVSNVAEIPEKRRIIIKNASKRINDIANNLLLQSKISHFPECNVMKSATDDFSELIFVVLDNIIAEKKFEYSNVPIKIQLNTADCAYNCFSKINLISFKRVLSNLINNSIEATNFNGQVIITLTADNKNIEITIEDNGCGIPTEIIPKVTNQGFSFGKKSGAGLGLSYAKQYIEQLHGQFFIYSEVNVGTKIIIKLLRTDPPDWFCHSLDVKEDSIVVILDDDPSIHDAWNDKLKYISSLNLLHFSKISDFDKLENNINSIYLIDYEFLGSDKNGLDIIENYGISKQSILVTSCFEDLIVRNRSEQLGVKIIPKLYVPYIPIDLTLNNLRTHILVFIDNDEMMRMAWTLAANECGKIISTYSSPEEFNKKMNKYDKNTPIYIDSELDNNVKGEVYAKELHMAGFNEIYLATGYSIDKFKNMPWIKAIIGKEPPFLLEQKAKSIN